MILRRTSALGPSCVKTEEIDVDGPAPRRRRSLVASWTRRRVGAEGPGAGTRTPRRGRPEKADTHELARVVPRQTGIVPIYKLIVPAELDSYQGKFRAAREQCMVRASNDHEAVLLWIKTRKSVSPEQKCAVQFKRGIEPGAAEGPIDWLGYFAHTQRAYLKEAERFMLWAVMQPRKPLSSMTLENCEAYRDFLADPTPRDKWCAPRGRDATRPR